jgi:PPM family protein phosphatase
MADNFFGITDTGRVRTNNEDAFIAQKLGGYIAACVIDGVGGYEGGEVAAAIARDSILNYFSVPSGDITTMMREAFVMANEKIEAAKKQNPDYESMACVVTLAMVDVAAKTFYYAHIGDTRLYLLRDNSLIKITKDQSFVGYLEDSGRIPEDEAMQHPKRNEINNAIGFAASLNSVDIETGSSPFLPGDTLLLCSDGLSDLLKSSEMLEILQQDTTLQVKAKVLVQAANERGGKDNITAVLVRNHRKPVVQKALKPAIASQDVKKNEIPSEQIPEYTEKPKRRKTGALTIGLSIFCFLLVAMVVFLLYNKERVGQNVLAVLVTEKTDQELAFQQLIDTTATKTVTLIDSMATLPMVLNDTVWIRRDTLRINGNGMRFLKSSVFSGPAFSLGDSCKYVVLENLSFENFETAILVSGKALHLKNVRFIGCSTPVSIQVPFADNAPVSGRLSNFFTPDSLHH